MDRHRDIGRNVLVAGDFNVHVGNRIVGNDEKVSKGGKHLVDLCDELEFEFVNNKVVGPSHTHYDVTSKTSRVLDLVLTNNISSHSSIKVDNELDMTPYRIKTINRVQERKYTDHLSIYGEIKVNRKKSKKKNKIKTWKMNTNSLHESKEMNLFLHCRSLIATS